MLKYFDIIVEARFTNSILTNANVCCVVCVKSFAKRVIVGYLVARAVGGFDSYTALDTISVPHVGKRVDHPGNCQSVAKQYEILKKRLAVMHKDNIIQSDA